MTRSGGKDKLVLSFDPIPFLSNAYPKRILEVLKDFQIPSSDPGFKNLESMRFDPRHLELSRVMEKIKTQFNHVLPPQVKTFCDFVESRINNPFQPLKVENFPEFKEYPLSSTFERSGTDRVYISVEWAGIPHDKWTHENCLTKDENVISGCLEVSRLGDGWKIDRFYNYDTKNYFNYPSPTSEIDIKSANGNCFTKLLRLVFSDEKCSKQLWGSYKLNELDPAQA